MPPDTQSLEKIISDSLLSGLDTTLVDEGGELYARVSWIHWDSGFRDSGLRIGRHAEIARQQVHGPERQHAEHLVARRERRRGGAEAAVTTADDHGVMRAERGLRDRTTQLLRLEQANVERFATRLQRGLDLFDNTCSPGVEQRAGARIEQDKNAFHGG